MGMRNAFGALPRSTWIPFLCDPWLRSISTSSSSCVQLSLGEIHGLGLRSPEGSLNQGLEGLLHLLLLGTAQKCNLHFWVFCGIRPKPPLVGFCLGLQTCLIDTFLPCPASSLSYWFGHSFNGSLAHKPCVWKTQFKSHNPFHVIG